MNGYAKLCNVGIEAPAEMLETVAGYDGDRVIRELTFALGMLDMNDSASLQWLACMIERRLTDLSVTA